MKTLLVMLQAVWLGTHITIGYVVAPMLFHFASQGELSRAIAGNIAGELFHVVMYLGLVTAALWWLFCRNVRQPSKILNVLIVLLAVSEWVITPVIAAIKQKQSQWLYDLVGGSFGMWHGISSSVYLLITLLLLLWTGKRLQINSQRR